MTKLSVDRILNYLVTAYRAYPNFENKQIMIEISQAKQQLLEVILGSLPKPMNIDFSFLGGSEKDIIHTQGEQEGYNQAIDDCLEKVKECLR